MIHETVLRLEEVAKSYPSPAGPVEVLKKVNLEVRRGEFLMVTGPSGSGKTTLLNLAALLDFPTAGRVVFLGKTVSGLEERQLCEMRKRAIGIVFQRFHLLSRRSALENVLFRFRYVGGDPRKNRQAAREALGKVGLATVAGRPARLLSAGEMQRVAIARAVALHPALLLADEPTGNLDATAAHGIMECFRELHTSGLTLILVTHNEALLPYASRHLVCTGGELRP